MLGGGANELSGTGFDGIKCVSPGETLLGSQDAVAKTSDPQDVEVFKSTDYIDVTVNADGSITTSTNDAAPWYLPASLIQRARGGMLSDKDLKGWRKARELADAAKSFSENGECGCEN